MNAAAGKLRQIKPGGRAGARMETILQGKLMTTSPYPASVLQRVSDALLLRHAELSASLADAAAAQLDAADGRGGVTDFKDLAIDQTQSDLRQVTSDRAATELAGVTAALQRLKAGTYGLCLDCGDPIPEQRLLALPASAYCASCQSSHELRDAHRATLHLSKGASAA
jgi:DnaK suppressor protein